MHVSDKGVIYIGSPAGAIRIPTSNPQEQTILLPNENIKCFYEGKDNHLWIGTHANGIYQLSSEEQTIKNFKNKAGNNNSLSNNNVRCIVEDHYGHLWIGTFYGLNQYNPKSDQWTHYVHQHQVSHSISHSSIFALYKDTQGDNNLKCIWFQKETGKLYIGTHTGGLTIFDTPSQTSRTLKHKEDDHNSLPANVINHL